MEDVKGDLNERENTVQNKEVTQQMNLVLAITPTLSKNRTSSTPKVIISKKRGKHTMSEVESEPALSPTFNIGTNNAVCDVCFEIAIADNTPLFQGPNTCIKCSTCSLLVHALSFDTIIPITLAEGFTCDACHALQQKHPTPQKRIPYL